MKTTGNFFDTVEFMCQQRYMLSLKLSKMTKAEMLDCFKTRKNEATIKPGA